jgi:hypothetical protein
MWFKLVFYFLQCAQIIRSIQFSDLLQILSIILGLGNNIRNLRCPPIGISKALHNIFSEHKFNHYVEEKQKYTENLDQICMTSSCLEIERKYCPFLLSYDHALYIQLIWLNKRQKLNPWFERRKRKNCTHTTPKLKTKFMNLLTYLEFGDCTGGKDGVLMCMKN